MVCVPEVPLKLTVPVPEVNVPEFVQSPDRRMVPEVTNIVPALVTPPETLTVLLLTFNDDPAGTLMPWAKTGKVVRKVAARVRQKKRKAVQRKEKIF